MFWPVVHAGLSVPMALAVALITAGLLTTVLRSNRCSLTAWLAGIAGVALTVPWLAGLAVKIWLMAHGQPTWPLAWFLRALPVLVPIAVLLALPPVVLALLARLILLRRAELDARSHRVREWLIAGGFVGSVVSMALAFTELFWDFDPVVFLMMPLIWLQYLPGATLGVLAGWLGGRYLCRRGIR